MLAAASSNMNNKCEHNEMEVCFLNSVFFKQLQRIRLAQVKQIDIEFIK